MQGSFQEKEALADIFSQVKNVDEDIFGVILKILRKERVQDCIGYLSDNRNQINLEQQILQQIENITQADAEQKLSFISNDMKQITDVLKNLKDHEFNLKDYSSQAFQEIKKELMSKIQGEKNMIELLKFLVQITSIDDQFIQCGSNSLHMLVMMKIDMRNQSFENIRMKNTSLIGGNFVRCNMNGSEFENVDISGVNFNGAQMFNCKWKNIKVHDLNKLDGHSSCVNSVCFSRDGNTLASGSEDNSIRLWDVKTGQQKAKLDGHSDYVISVCFSSDGNTLASVSIDQSIRLWDAKTGQQKAKLNCLINKSYPVN